MTPRFKRRIQLIRPSLQLRLIGSFGAICGLALLTQAMVLPRVVAAHRNHEKDPGQHGHNERAELAGDQFRESPYQVWQSDSNL